MEKRNFGNTGLKTSLLGFGGFHLLEIPVIDVDFLLNRYLDSGGNYIETASSYGNGESERKIGATVSGKRSQYILATKTTQRKKQGCIESIEQSLVNLNTDYVDVLLMHAVGTSDELYTILGPDGALEGAINAVRDGKVRYIGISMHGQPDVLIEALNAYNFSAVMSTMNYYDHFNFPKIENELMPLANSKNTAIILMKPLADGLLWRSASQAFRYAFSLPVSVVVAGINNRQMLESDLKFTEEFRPITEQEKEALFKNAIELGNYVCRQCGKCMPCPEGIEIPEIFMLEGYYDRQMADGTVVDVAEYALRERLRFWFGSKDRAIDLYSQLAVKTDKCTGCGQCTPKCPYGIDIVRKLGIADYKLAQKPIF